MRYRSEKNEVEARKQVARYRVISEGTPKGPLPKGSLPKCTMTDEDVELWLYLWLKARGFLLSDHVKAVAGSYGISKTRLRTARRNLGVVTWHWIDEKDDDGFWFWELP